MPRRRLPKRFNHSFAVVQQRIAAHDRAGRGEPSPPQQPQTATTSAGAAGARVPGLPPPWSHVCASEGAIVRRLGFESPSAQDVYAKTMHSLFCAPLLKLKDLYLDACGVRCSEDRERWVSARNS